ncbi:SDR family oxidoreductase [Streptomyces sp. NPDC091215]|uniref:SDR family oxidoreductase n=1 Tax=Streptomyces sp. NPDC091215 TaxID=3155192 RepID=UPI00343184AC
MTAPVRHRVLVTGGATGIGRAIVQAHLANGARVHVTDIDPGALAELQGVLPQVTTTCMDVADPDAYTVLRRDIDTGLRGLDAVVCNVGISGPTMPVADYRFEDWQRVIGVNLTGVFLTAATGIPYLRESDRGALVVLSSAAGRFGYANRSAYSASKWGLIGLVKTLALELGPSGITVNAVQPGAVDGPRLRQVFEARAQLSGRTAEEEASLGLDSQSIKRFTTADEVAALVSFLTGPQARTISGQAFPVDGDLARA